MNHWNDNLQHSVFVDASKRKAVYAGGEGYLEHRAVRDTRGDNGGAGSGGKSIHWGHASYASRNVETVSKLLLDQAKGLFSSKSKDVTTITFDIHLVDPKTKDVDHPIGHYTFTAKRDANGQVTISYTKLSN